MAESDSELNPSELGKLDFWEDTYALEMENLKDHGDVGKIWFGEATASKIVRYIDGKLALSRDQDKIVDLGCGNGMMLVDLASCGFKRLVGLDYSQKSIDLAEEVLKKHGVQNVELRVCDITSLEMEDDLGDFKVVHDKGTYDAISLNPVGAKERRFRYNENVNRMLRADGYFIITSCNWTKEELMAQFGGGFKLFWEIPNKKFSFGGQSGSRVTQLVFVKKSQTDN